MGFIKIHDFRHSWKVPSSPNDPWSSRWVQMGPSSSKWSLDLQIKPIIFPINDTKKQQQNGNLENLQKWPFFDKMASFCMPFFGGGPHGARDHWGPIGVHHRATTGKTSCFSAKNKSFAPYGDSGRFDVTGWSENILRIKIDPMLPSFCLTLESMFWHSWKLPSSPNDPWAFILQMIFGPPNKTN